MSLRVVVDTSTLVSAAIRPDSVPYRALSLAILRHRVYTSASALSELERILKQSKFDRYARAGSRSLFFEKFRRDAIAVDVSDSATAQALGVCRDPKDEPFLALCLAVRGNVLISGDLDLLTLHPWHGAEILTAAQFLNQYGEHPS